jgi:hypothetical protein
MSEGEHTIIGKIPRERLNQIASRKLSSLAIPVRLAPDRETLEGELTFSPKVINPTTGQVIPRGRFVVIGHDHLRFADPPLAALDPIDFFDLDRPASVEQLVIQTLNERATRLQEWGLRLRALHLETSLDSERLTLRAVVKTDAYAFEILAGAGGVRVSRVAPVGGVPFDVSIAFRPLALETFASLLDLERYLVEAVPEMEQGAAGDQKRFDPARPGTLAPTPPPRNALTLALLQDAFGGDAIVAPNAPVELIQEFEHGGTRYRFVASREMGATFRGRLIGPSGDVWSDRFDLSGFPGTEQMVAAALGLGEMPPNLLAPAERPFGRIPEHLLPHPGEVWVMSVVVEEAGNNEVRYVGTDIDGHPYGAARVLKRAEFEAVFSSERGAWRLLILIDQVQGENVIYRQLDRQRQPIGSPRKMATAILVANFVPETPAY